MTSEEETKVKTRRDAFAKIAFWQIMAFVFLLCFVWASELLDIPYRVFGRPATPFNVFRAFILSAGIITAGIVAIGYTYEQQRAILRKLLKTCMYCHRVKTADGHWEHVEEYFIRHYPVAMDRGACPDCDKMIKEAAERKGHKKEDGLDSLTDLVV